MFNPMLATVLLGGCKGNTTLEHITIYWLGASAGAIIAFVVYPRIKHFVYASKHQHHKTEKVTENRSGKKEKSF